MKRKKIFYHSDYSICNTGFGKIAKNILSYLYRTGKYDLVHYCCGVPEGSPDLFRTPWSSIGSVPANQAEINNYLNSLPPEQRETRARLLQYGDYKLNEAIKREKPDIYYGVQDVWFLDINKFWWNKIPCILHTTIDSRPILPHAVEIAPKIQNYWMWSDFATKEFDKLNFKHVKTVHGPLDVKNFYRLQDNQRKTLRQIFSIPEDAIVIGMVARNQLRKTFYATLAAWKQFKQNNPKIKPYLLFHTSFGIEGWDLVRLAKKYGVPKDEMLTTFVCRSCKNYDIKPFEKQDIDSRFCNGKGTCITTSVVSSVNEQQLTEIFNLMDIYCHPMTSGGTEIPVIEAKLCEIPTLVTCHTCGEELCEEGSGSLPLDFDIYLEIGTEFEKSNTKPSSIVKQLSKIVNMNVLERRKLGRMGREWAIKNYSIDSVGKDLERVLDGLEPTNYDFIEQPPEGKSPTAIISDIPDNKTWIKSLYKEILKMTVEDNDQGLGYWLSQLSGGMKREQIEAYFRGEAQKENQKHQTVDFEATLQKTGRKTFLIVLKESVGDIFMATSLLESFKEQYPDTDFYFATDPQYFPILEGNPHIYKVIAYHPMMESETTMTGIWNHGGFFNYYCHLGIATQRVLNYISNSNIALTLTDKKLCTC